MGHVGSVAPWATPAAGKPAAPCQEEKSCCYLKIIIVIIAVIVIGVPKAQKLKGA